MPLHSGNRNYPEGYQAHLPPEADVNVEAMRKQAERDEADRKAEQDERHEGDDQQVRTATAKPGDKQPQ